MFDFAGSMGYSFATGPIACKFDPNLDLPAAKLLINTGIKTIPRGLEIDKRHVKFTVQKPTGASLLPIEHLESLFILRIFYEGIADCRVKDNQGTWWIVIHSRDHFLYFVNASNVSVSE